MADEKGQLTSVGRILAERSEGLAGLTLSEDGRLLNWRGVNYVAQNGAGRDCRCGCDPWPSGSCGERAPVAVPPTCPTCGGSGVTQETHDGGTHPVHCPCTYLSTPPGGGGRG